MRNPWIRRVKIVAIAGGATVVAVCTVVALLLTGHFTRVWPRPGSDEVVGVKLDVSDYGGPDQTSSGGAVLAVPGKDVAEFWRLVGQETSSDLERIAFIVRPESVRAAHGVVGGVGLFGRFTLRPIASGPHLVCDAGRILGDGAYQVYGCAEVQLTAPGRIEVTFGEAGFRVKANG
jgi:hypothetical protein